MIEGEAFGVRLDGTAHLKIFGLVVREVQGIAPTIVGATL